MSLPPFGQRVLAIGAGSPNSKFASGTPMRIHRSAPPAMRPVLAFILALVVCLLSPAARAGRDEIRALAAEAAQAPLRAQRPYDDRGWLERFYAPGDYAAAWQGGNAGDALAVLQGAGQDGLAPADYQAEPLARQLGAATPDQADRTDVALTAAMLRYLADLRFGRVRSSYDSALPDARLQAFDPVEQLRAALAAHQLSAAVAAATPSIPLYARTKAALARYRALARTPQPSLPPAPALEPGSAYAGAKALRERLTLLGDLAGDAPPSPRGRYGPELADAVRHFQRRHGLRDDGVLGKETLAALNAPPGRRVRQLELTLERLRWLPDFPPGPMIAINLPSFHLWAFDTGGNTPAAPLEMRVIVGAAVKTRTPLFVGQLRYLEFNPYWNVPRSIEREEIIPKLAQNPAYLAQNAMELVPLAGGGATSIVDAAALQALRAGKLRVRQRPGPQNALGAVKFSMPNPMNIYLHSTSARELFKRTRRDLSHGCIRVERPVALAQFVLRDQPQWSVRDIEAAMAPGHTRTVHLTAPIPVLVFYATAVAAQDGQALFPEDVYGLDPVLEQALKAHPPLPSPP